MTTVLVEKKTSLILICKANSDLTIVVLTEVARRRLRILRLHTGGSDTQRKTHTYYITYTS